ncbi:alanine racemase (plasmid) [Paraburkholderia caribensis]|nr:alanine racemase [Paraburkholderia caribensis]AUT57919.1 DSD1 family PLP-dependent enzyme [Paraburkholderia caribensis]
MHLVPARVGDAIDEIDTPALLLDLDAFEKNLQKMADFTALRNIRLRPHAKTHRCPAIALQQVAMGASGVCCQTVGEAEVLVHSGIADILVTNQLLDNRKLIRLAALAKTARIALCFDSYEQIAHASRAACELAVEMCGLVEIDVGMGRGGVTPNEAPGLATAIVRAPGLRFSGIQAYQGRAQHLPLHVDRERAIAQAANHVRATKFALQRAGLGCGTVSGGGTGTFRMETQSGQWTELQCGSYIFMDGEYSAVKDEKDLPYTEFQQSLFVLATVVSATRPGGAVLNAGLKSYSTEKGLPTIYDRNDIQFVSASDEHGTLAISPETRLLPGMRLKIVPSHCDPTVNLHDTFVCIRNDRVEALWPIAARGASH